MQMLMNLVGFEELQILLMELMLLRGDAEGDAGSDADG